MNIKQSTLRRWLWAVAVAAWLVSGCLPKGAPFPKKVMPFAGADTAQVDHLLRRMSIEEKIGQLLVWEAPPSPDATELSAMMEQVSRGHLSGYMVEGLSISAFVRFADGANRAAPVPLLVATRQQFSLHSHFAPASLFPSAMTVAALDSAALETQLQQTFLEQCRALGINTLFTPLRAYEPGAANDPDKVLPGTPDRQTHRIINIVSGANQSRMLTVGNDLPRLQFVCNDTLRDSLFYRYQVACRNGMAGIVLGDGVFAHDTLSRTTPGFLREYLASDLDFHGLTLARIGRVEKPYLKLIAGADLMLTAEPQRVFYAIVKLLERRRISESLIDGKVRRILLAKAWINGGALPLRSEKETIGFNEAKRVFVNSEEPVQKPGQLYFSDRLAAWSDALECYFEDPYWEHLSQDIHERSITVVRDSEAILPLQYSRLDDVQVLVFGEKRWDEFLDNFSRYADYSSRQVMPLVGQVVSEGDLPGDHLPDKLIVVFENIDLLKPANAPFLKKLNGLADRTELVVVNVGALGNLAVLQANMAVLQIYERNAITEAAGAQVIFGGRSAEGKLPVSPGISLPIGTGKKVLVSRLGYDKPERVGINPEKLSNIDTIVLSAIDNGVFPGCQVLVAKDGMVIYSKAFGQPTYKSKVPINTTTVYDVASITKAAATTMAIMRMYDDKTLELRSPLEKLLPLEPGATIGEISIEDLLRHRSGLQSQAPIGKFLGVRAVPAKGCGDYFCRYRKGDYEVQVCEDLFFNRKYADSLRHRVHRLRVERKQPYRYGDVNYLLLQEVVEQQSATGLDAYMDSLVYLPLGLRYTTFHPLRRFSKKFIAPTELDRKWRRTLIHGYTHDPAAALLGGVAGNAGLFANAEDLAVIFQMLLNGGAYGGRRYFREETVALFTEGKRKQERTLGFDGPGNRKYPTFSRFISKTAFGHTGFTGTCVWADPEANLIYVFLSNRVHPNARNSKIQTEAIRSRVHDVVYESLHSFITEPPVLPTLSEE